MILELAPPRRQVVVAAVVPVGGAIAAQPGTVAQLRLQQAQAGCAQADAYQNYVNQVVSSQNTTSDGINQILQTLADNTTDPNLQDALSSAIGQPNPINDALDQQLENQANAYESTCQARLAAAQAAIPPDPTQQAGGDSGQAGAVPATDPANAASYPAGSQTDPTSTMNASPSAADVATPAAASQPSTCTGTRAMDLPQPKAPWGNWAALGSSGLVFDVSRVNATTLTWRFLNAGPRVITGMQFNYSYVDADTNQPATQSDLLPFALAPGQSVGGWTAYTANTRGNVTLAITQISCQ